MWLESEVGVGSTFGFSRPATSPDAADERRPRTELDEPRLATSSSSRTTDRPRPADRLPRGAGVQVPSARDGSSGLDAVRRTRAGGSRPRHPAARHGRVGRARGPQGRPRDRRHPRDRRVDGRRAGAGRGARRGREYLVKPVSRDDLLAALGRGSWPADAAADERTAEAGEHRMTAHRILVVEDNAQEPQAGPRRPRVRRLRGDRGDGPVSRVSSSRPSAAPGPRPHGPPAARHRRHRGAAAAPGESEHTATCRSSP